MLVFLRLLLLLAPLPLMAAEKAYEPTPPGTIEVKTLPAGRLLESRSEGSYFARSNNLFGPLFRYISDHGIGMTTPVEATIEPGRMYFWVSPQQRDKTSGDRNGVTVIDVPARTVAAVGSRGGYSERNYEEAKERLLAWLDQSETWEAAGEPFAVFWDGPMTPWFLKTFEVQVVIRATEG